MTRLPPYRALVWLCVGLAGPLPGCADRAGPTLGGAEPGELGPGPTSTAAGSDSPLPGPLDPAEEPPAPGAPRAHVQTAPRLDSRTGVAVRPPDHSAPDAAPDHATPDAAPDHAAPDAASDHAAPDAASDHAAPDAAPDDAAPDDASALDEPDAPARTPCPPRPTTRLRIVANLDAELQILSAPWDAQDPLGTSNFALQAVRVFDSAGGSHALTIALRMEARGAFSYHVLADGADLAPASPGVNVEVGSGGFAFTVDGALGAEYLVAPVSLPFERDAPPQQLEVDFGRSIAEGGTGLGATSAFAGETKVLELVQDGRGADAFDCADEVFDQAPPAASPLPECSLPASATTRVDVAVILPLLDAPPTAAWDPHDPSTGSYFPPLLGDVYDEHGAAHELVVYFRGLGPREFEYRALAPGADLEPPAAVCNVEVGRGTLAFTPNGALYRAEATAPVAVTFRGGTSAQAITLSFGDPIESGGDGLRGTVLPPLPHQAGYIWRQDGGPWRDRDPYDGREPRCHAPGGPTPLDAGAGPACEAWRPSPTSRVTLGMAMDTDLARNPPAAGPWDPALLDLSDSQTSVSVRDHVGALHALAFLFRRSSASALEYYALVDGGELVGGTQGASVVVGHGTISIGSDGFPTGTDESMPIEVSFAPAPMPQQIAVHFPVSGERVCLTDPTMPRFWGQPVLCTRIDADGHAWGDVNGLGGDWRACP